MQNDLQHKTGADTCQNILVIKLSALGDFIQALGPMAAIRKHHPDAKITLLTTKAFVSIAEACGYFDEIQIDARPKWHQLTGWIKLRADLNAGAYDRVYDLQNNDRSNFYFRLMSPKPEWVGIAPGASHRNSAAERIAGQAFDGHVQTLALAGVKDVTIDRMEWIKADTTRFNLSEKYVLIVPGSAPSRPEKRWPAKQYSDLCNELSALGYQPVLIGTEAEKEATSAIAQLCRSAIDLTGQTSLFEIIALARHAKAAIGNDTGPMHMIAPTACPTLVLFSRHSNPARHAPKGESMHFIQRDNLAELNVEDVLKSLKTDLMIN